jgi:hypothetical protein
MPKNIKILLVVALLAIGLAGLFMLKPTPQNANKGTQIFSCDLGDTTLTVNTENNQLSFAYGDTHITGNNHAAYHHDMWPHAEDHQLRFRQGDNSYVIFNRWASPDYEGNAAVDYSGLLIFKGYDKIDLKFCKDSAQFLPGFDLTSLPDDGKNIVPDKAASAASIDDVLNGHDSDEMIPGAYRDEHNCTPSAGYEWSEEKQECVRPWLEEK